MNHSYYVNIPKNAKSTFSFRTCKVLHSRSYQYTVNHHRLYNVLRPETAASCSIDIVVIKKTRPGVNCAGVCNPQATTV